MAGCDCERCSWNRACFCQQNAWKHSLRFSSLWQVNVRCLHQILTWATAFRLQNPPQEYQMSVWGSLSVPLWAPVQVWSSSQLKSSPGTEPGLCLGNTNTNSLFQVMGNKTSLPKQRGVFGSGMWIPAAFLILSQNFLRCLMLPRGIFGMRINCRMLQLAYADLEKALPVWRKCWPGAVGTERPLHLAVTSQFISQSLPLTDKALPP